MASFDRAIVLSVSSVLAVASAASMADQTASPNNAAQSSELAEVVVLGSRPIAESEAAALRIQRNSDNLVAVAAANPSPGVVSASTCTTVRPAKSRVAIT